MAVGRGTQRPITPNSSAINWREVFTGVSLHACGERLSSALSGENMEIIDGGGVTSACGFVAGAAACGLKTRERRPDIALVYSQLDCTAAAVFTRNQVAAAPVLLDRDTIASNNVAIRGVVANAGNANACTGAPGLWSARQMQKNAAFALGCREDQILVLSTGVIGVQLPMTLVNVGIDAAAKRLRRRS